MRIQGISDVPEATIKHENPAATNGATDRAEAVSEQSQAHSGVATEDFLRMKRETVDGKNMVYRLVDSRTGTVVSQVPSQQVLNVAQSIEALIRQERRESKLDVES